jgi:hypothetical protein
MRKFFLMTRGRTGSTAVIDELSKSMTICALQELFMIYNYGDKEEFEFVYNFVAPFDVWKTKEDPLRRLPSRLYDDGLRATRYLARAESQAMRQSAKAFGFKVLSYHFEERPYLGRLLKQRGYWVIYLIRNLARQVLSSMVANERGVFGVSKDFEDARRYHVDIDKFQRIVEWERDAMEREHAWLKAAGFNFVVVSYEEFLSDRQSFYDKVFRFLQLPSELPPPSDWGIAIKDLTYTIENYEAVVKRAEAIGVPIDL